MTGLQQAPRDWAPCAETPPPGRPPIAPPLPRGQAGSGMRVLIIDSDAARAALVAEGLAEVTPLEVRRAPNLQAAEPGFAADVIVIACENPERDTLESLREASRTDPRPVVMFVDRSTPELAEAAVQAGVAAYVVDGLSPGRVRPVLEVAMSRFAIMQRMRSDLDKAKADLASRKVIERAKGLLMKERRVDEETAYKALRKLAMDTGRPLAAVAADLLAYAGVLNGDEP